MFVETIKGMTVWNVRLGATYRPTCEQQQVSSARFSISNEVLRKVLLCEYRGQLSAERFRQSLRSQQI